ncbi:MAG: MATE family efflux transporter [Armatimonadetes bacterium]|nr:MATE family efflux transporter [Armatimonadota bacterium]
MTQHILQQVPAILRERWNRPSGYGEVLSLAGPLVLSTGTMTVQQFVNRMFLSWYSQDALAASLPAGALSFTLLCFFIGTASYANTFVAQYHGSKQPKRIAASVWQAIYLSVGAGGLVIPFAFLSEPLFNLAGHASELRELESVYFRILMFGGGFGILSSAVSSFFTGRGLTRTVMLVNVAATLVNCVLDYGMIFGRLGMPEMGIAGAAWASVIASAIGAAMFLWLFLFGNHAAEFGVWQAHGLDRDLMARLLRFGTPSGLHFMLDILGWSLFILLVGRLGVTELGATNLAFQVNGIVFMPMIGFAVATSTLVGQRLGENRPLLAARATWSAFQLTFVYMAFFAALYVLIPRVFLLPFGAKADPQDFAPLCEMAVTMLRFVALYSLLDGINLIFSAALKGAGDTLFVMVVSTTLSMGLMVVPTWLICRDGDGSVWAAWTALTTFIMVLALFFLWRFLQGKWKTMRVTEAPHVPLNPTYPHAETPVVDAEVL